jgi:hypothetical protein
VWVMKIVVGSTIVCVVVAVDVAVSTHVVSTPVVPPFDTVTTHPVGLGTARMSRCGLDGGSKERTGSGQDHGARDGLDRRRGHGLRGREHRRLELRERIGCRGRARGCRICGVFMSTQSCIRDMV